MVTIKSIIQAAHNSGRELTENQAKSILIRHQQLTGELEDYYTSSTLA